MLKSPDKNSVKRRLQEDYKSVPIALSKYKNLVKKTRLYFWLGRLILTCPASFKKRQEITPITSFERGVFPLKKIWPFDTIERVTEEKDFFCVKSSWKSLARRVFKGSLFESCRCFKDFVASELSFISTPIIDLLITKIKQNELGHLRIWYYYGWIHIGTTYTVV